MSLLPFDETGSLATNLKTEQHTISSANGIDHAYIVPEWAPFFKTGFAVYHVESNRYLTEGIDFEFTHDFVEAFERISSYVYGSITLLDTTLVGTFKIRLQSLGGDFVVPESQAIANGFDALLNLQTITWEDIISPEAFPPTLHELPLNDIEGVTEIINQLMLMRQGIDAGNADIKFEDITDLDTAFTIPLLASLESIALAIREKAYSNNLYYEEELIKDTVVEVSYVLGQWTSVPLELILAETGSFIIDWDVLGVNDTDDGTVEFRWLSNDAVVSKSYNKNIVSSHSAETTLQLQLRVKEGTGTKVTIADLTKGAMFRALRVGS